MESKVLFPGVRVGDPFSVGGVEFIRFPDVDGNTPAVAKGSVFRSIFGKNTNLAESAVLRKLKDEVLPKIVSEVGEENLCTFQTDLTALDGLKPHAPMESKISLPTFDFYRRNVEIFDRHQVDAWWWLATPDSGPEHSDWPWVVCVSPGGYFDYINCGSDCGVRPFCIFSSSIFDPCEG